MRSGPSSLSAGHNPECDYLRRPHSTEPWTVGPRHERMFAAVSAVARSDWVRLAIGQAASRQFEPWAHPRKGLEEEQSRLA